MASTALEQLVLEMLNRARLDPAAEAARLGISLNEGLASGKISAAAKQPLAPSVALTNSARGHSQQMINVDKFAHEGIGDGTVGSRMEAAGYGFTGAWKRGENIAFNGTTAALNATAFAIKNENDLFVDAGYTGRGHRINILDGDYREIGVGLATGPYKIGTTTYNASMLTHDFAKTGTDVFITGVAINDTNRNDFYDVGEARANVIVTVESGASVLGSSTTTGSGGYAAAIAPSGGPVDVTFSGGGLAHGVSVTIASAAQNVKVDLSGTSKVLSSASTSLGEGATSLLLLGVANLAGTGNAAANSITGNRGSNALSGGAGGDIINGVLGNDVITGGTGRDVMTGGGGNDQFRFTSIADMGNSATTRDVITDMHKAAVTGIDRINVSLIDAKAAEGTTNDAFAFLAGKGAAFSNSGQIRWFQQDLAGTANDKTIIVGNTDHNLSTSEFQIEIRGLVSLAATDFYL